MANVPTYAQLTYVYTGESWNSLFGQSTATRGRHLQKSYEIVNASWGLEMEGYTVELFARNLLDERGEVYRNSASWDSRVTTNRPRTFGVRFRQRFE
jgi:iron complex outermembrane receptor protein